MIIKMKLHVIIRVQNIVKSEITIVAKSNIIARYVFNT